jgi:hypothetical protein
MQQERFAGITQNLPEAITQCETGSWYNASGFVESLNSAAHAYVTSYARETLATPLDTPWRPPREDGTR